MDCISVVHKKGININPGSRHRLGGRIYYHRYLYILFLPALIFYLLFSYKPMYGAILAFKDLNYSKGIMGSPWTSMHGLKHFYDLMSDMDFARAFGNTVIISLQRLVFEFPVGIILAILLNEIKKNYLKRITQTILTFPHFLSWVVVTGIFFNLLGDDGVFNAVLSAVGMDKIHLLTQQSTFRGLLYATSNWKEAGWGTIIYLASISNINPSLYEAAIVDGAKRFQLIRYITWPAILSVVGMMLILQIGNMMNAGFDQIFNMYNAAVYNKVDILDTFIYRRTFINGLDLASSTAIGLFKSVINFILLFTANTTVRRFTGKGIY
jgi:ABC-type polysaccharide transport system, permease component